MRQGLEMNIPVLNKGKYLDKNLPAVPVDWSRAVIGTETNSTTPTTGLNNNETNSKSPSNTKVTAKKSSKSIELQPGFMFVFKGSGNTVVNIYRASELS